jgi:hypothetical protein
MGVPTSSVLSEVFLQQVEHTHIPDLAIKHKIANYLRFVDDILIIFDSNEANIQTILADFNTLHLNLKFTAETEHNTLNFLDTTIHKTQDGITISIYRKPTFTDAIIPYTSNHPPQHKYAAVRFLYNRLNTYQLQTEDYKQEENLIHNILHNNSFPITTRNNNPPYKNRNTEHPTYTGPEVGYLHLHR